MTPGGQGGSYCLTREGTACAEAQSQKKDVARQLRSDVGGRPVTGSRWWLVRTTGDRAEEGDWNLGLPVGAPRGELAAAWCFRCEALSNVVGCKPAVCFIRKLKAQPNHVLFAAGVFSFYVNRIFYCKISKLENDGGDLGAGAAALYVPHL